MSNLVLQLLVVPLGYPGVLEVPELHMNMYTAVGFMGALLAAVNILLLLLMFKPHDVPGESSEHQEQEGDSQAASANGHCNINTDEEDTSRHDQLLERQGYSDAPGAYAIKTNIVQGKIKVGSCVY